MKDFERYGGYYCGVCKSIGKRYGNIPRAVLSYDAAFLALVLAGVTDEENSMAREHCIIHHLKKKTVVRSGAVDYAADIMLILAWYKLADDAHDEGKLPARIGAGLTKGLFKKLKKARPDVCRKIQAGLVELSLCEEEKCADMDQAGEAFGKVMAAVMTGYPEAAGSGRVLERIGYLLGRWIYLMDAWEDIEDNIRTGSYNPLICRFAYRAEEQQEDFRDRIHNDVERNLMLYLAEMAKFFDLLDIHQNKDIIENIVYMGLLRRTEKALGKDKEKDGKSL